MPSVRPTLVHGAALLLAAAACTWFVIGIRQAHDTERAGAILSNGPPLTGAQQHRVGSLLNAASFLNPDTQVKVLKAQLAVEQGHEATGDAIVLGVVRDEPMNALAWFWLAQHAARPKYLVLAYHRLARLAPRP
jgi:hypothetical protein